MKHVIIASILSVFLPIASSPTAFADQQEHVDYLVQRIERTLRGSLDADNWKDRYKVAAWNIADLRRTLRQGGRLTSNPVQAFQQQLSKQMQQHQLVLKTLAEAERKVSKYPGKLKARLMIKISLKLFKVLKPIVDHSPGDAVDLAKSDMKSIKRDFKQLKTRAETRRKIKELRDKVLPALNKVQKRYYALIPLVTAYSKLPGAQGLAAAAAARSRRAAARRRLQSQANSHPAEPKGRHWRLVQTMTWVDPHLNDHECYQTSLRLADGSFTRNEQKMKCNKPYFAYTVSGSWSKPPQYLIPGRKYQLKARLSGKFTVSGNGYLSIYADVADTKCGGSTRRNVAISGALRISWNGKKAAARTGTFTAPRESYGNAQGRFQIKATTNNGCVRYIYQWVNSQR